MKLHRLLSLLLTVVICLSAFADTDSITIVNHITDGNDNKINQPDKLLERLVKVDAVDEEDDEQKEELNKPVNGRMAGYRVQVFSDNNARTAKNEARSKQRMIATRFPRYQTYVMYTSPYWRLKVGDFKSQQDAQKAADEIGKAFPAFRKEIRVVRDRISIQD